MKKILALIITSILFVTNVNAASKCSYEEQTKLNGKAGNVKVSYEIKETEVKADFFDVYKNELKDTMIVEVFEISVLNISEDIYVVVKNDFNKDSKTIRYSDSNNGIAKFTWDKRDNITNFTFEIYSSNKTSCPNEIYKTIYLTTPRYNTLYGYEECKNIEDFYLCQKYVTFKDISEANFFSKISQYKNKEIDDNGEVIPSNKTIFDRVFDFVKENKWFVLSGIVLISGAVYAINYTKNKKQRDLGL